LAPKENIRGFNKTRNGPGTPPVGFLKTKKRVASRASNTPRNKDGWGKKKKNNVVGRATRPQNQKNHKF